MKEKIIREFDKYFPNPKCELNFSNNLELLIAVILSAQCTDKRVNVVTDKLFKKYKTVQDFANLQIDDLQREIFSVGLYHSKAKNIINACKEIFSKYNGNIPDNFKDLTSLAGVGRKTANVVLSVGFNQNTFAVDTHIFRVSNRLGIGDKKSVYKCEEKLKKYFDKNNWGRLHLQMVLFGRNICKSRNPKCENCNLKQYCKYYQKKGERNVFRQGKNNNKIR